ncbi:BcsR/BcsP family cellulose biosynthesis protein [Aeromonas caviae]
MTWPWSSRLGVSLSYQDIAARERLAALCARFPLLAEVAVKGPEGTGPGCP